jgi:YegS/Rv2252/BmrU family lipid kinase
MKENSSRTIAVVNLSSGKLAPKGTWEEAARLLEKTIGPFTTAFTRSTGDGTVLARKALESGADRIIAVGGDGTLGEVVTGFFRNGQPVKPEAVFAFIMCGTGNDFQKSFGRAHDIKEGIAALGEPRGRLIDVGRITYLDHNGVPSERCFLNMASFGMSGAVDRRVGRVPMRGLLGGKLSFLLATATTLATYRNRKVRIVADGRDAYRGPVRVAVAANCKFAGGGMMFAPGAEPDDGLLDLVILGDISTPQIARHMGSIYKGSHLNLDGVVHTRARRIEAFSEEETLLDVDGEAPGRLPATFEILPAALKIEY